MKRLSLKELERNNMANLRTIPLHLVSIAACLLAVRTHADDPAMTDSARKVGVRAARWSLANQTDNLGYHHNCTAYGILKMARVTGDDDLRIGIEKAFRPYLLEGKSPNRDNAAKNPAHRWFGFVPLELYRQTGNRKYLERGIELAEAQYANADSSGMPVYTKRWYVDDIYGATTMQSLAYAATGREKYLNRAVMQVLTYAKKFQEPSGLFYHGPESQFFWGRGNGWCAAAFAELLSVMPESHAKRPEVLAAYRRMMDALLMHQDRRGIWRQLIDDPKSWVETSSSGMFLFALSEGVKRRWLPDKPYRTAVERAWPALAAFVDQQGRLAEVCVGTGHGKTREHYLDRPRQLGDAHGQAGMLWAAASIIEKTPDQYLTR